MPAVDFLQTQKQVVALLNAGPDDGSFAATVGDDRYGSIEVIKEAILQADEEIVLAILDTDGHSSRQDLIAWSAALNYLDPIPAHIGPVGAVQITVSNGGVVVPGVPATVEEIRQWRLAANNAFGAAAHNAAGSPLGGYFAIRDDVAHFTGYTMQVKIATYTRNAAACQAPNIYQAGVTAGALAKLFARDGASTQKASHFGQQQFALIQVIRSGDIGAAPPLEQFESEKG